jgi:hypothetical protein
MQAPAGTLGTIHSGQFQDREPRGKKGRRYRCRLDVWLADVMGIEGIPIPLTVLWDKAVVGLRVLIEPRSGSQGSCSPHSC